jgi:hypothetical protein
MATDTRREVADPLPRELTLANAHLIFESREDQQDRHSPAKDKQKISASLPPFLSVIAGLCGLK